jgi:hypothetical protein
LTRKIYWAKFGRCQGRVEIVGKFVGQRNI